MTQPNNTGPNLEELGDVPLDAFRAELHQLADWIADYREQIEEYRVAPKAEPGAISRQLPAQGPEQAVSFDEIFADFQNILLPGVLQWSHPQFAAYFGSTTTAPGIEGEILAAALNVNAFTWRVSPVATELETVVIGWLRQWLGLPESFGGVVYDTASIGIMHALAVAREEAAPCSRKEGLTGRDLPKFTVYTSDQAHSSVEKAVIALGLGEQNVRRVMSDSEFRLDVDKLRRMIAEDRAAELRPLACVATVGTTSTASVDPVRPIAEVCHAQKIWLHIDGAYGAGLALLPEHRWITDGWAEADSIVINPHKMLFVPFDFSVLYVRDLERLRRVFTLVPEYLRGDTVEAERNYMDYGVQLGRRFRALKAWMVFRRFGRAGIAARIREHIRLAHLFAEWVASDTRFALAAPVVMGVICFRVTAAADDRADQINSSIVEHVNASGQAYLNQTKLKGRKVIRVGLGNVLTTETHLRNVWELILKAADAFVAGRGEPGLPP
ncbi:MAG: pyridoxal phosphate-dependent decarboxylase family protein [Chthoniobacterales bacterium]